MRRILALSLLILALAPGTWLRQRLPRYNDDQVLSLTPVALPSAAERAVNLGAFALEGIWRLDSPNRWFGSYSALVVPASGRLLALSDRGQRLEFAPPGAPPVRPRIGSILRRVKIAKEAQDAEAAAFDPASAAIWIAWENTNKITRQRLDFGPPAATRPAAMAHWGANAGPEAMTRLADGRFVVLREGFDGLLDDSHHRALLFAGDPVGKAALRAFTFAGPAGFSPTDMAPLPDGRVLILMRKLVWPFPARMAGRIVIADPAAIRPGAIWRGRTVAMLTSSLPVDNMEGLAIEPRGDGRVTVWLISDDNGAVTQRTLLWKLAVDPARL